MTTLAPNDPAPDFELSDATGHFWQLSDFGPGKVIVYFYPAALTPGCTTQAIDFTARRDEFAAAGCQIVGISPDTPEKLTRFIALKELTITLLADPEKKTINDYGVWGTKTIYGKQMQGLIRSTFIVEVDAKGQGTIVEALYDIKSTGHADRLAEKLGIT